MKPRGKSFFIEEELLTVNIENKLSMSKIIPLSQIYRTVYLLTPAGQYYTACGGVIYHYNWNHSANRERVSKQVGESNFRTQWAESNGKYC